MWRPLHKLPCIRKQKKMRRFEPQDIWGADSSYDGGWSIPDDDEVEYGSPEYYDMLGLLPEAVRDIEGAEYIEANGLKIGHASLQGHRISNEDAHVIDSKSFPHGHTLCAIFDGHAGPDAAIFASENLSKLLLDNVHWKEYSVAAKKNVELIKTALVETYQLLDKELRSSDQVKYGLDTSGCTAVCVMITPTHVICASVGDSRAVISSTRSAPKITTTPLSFDHCPQNQLETERIIAAGGTVEFDRVNGELAMSRAFGDFQYKSNKTLPDGEQMVISIPDVSIYRRTEADYMLLLACDGVFDVYSNEEAMETLAHFDESKVRRDATERERLLSEALINEAVDKGSTDNISGIVVSFC